jgi:hypothetical protein
MEEGGKEVQGGDARGEPSGLHVAGHQHPGKPDSAVCPTVAENMVRLEDKVRLAHRRVGFGGGPQVALETRGEGLGCGQQLPATPDSGYSTGLSTPG